MNLYAKPTQLNDLCVRLHFYATAYASFVSWILYLLRSVMFFASNIDFLEILIFKYLPNLYV